MKLSIDIDVDEIETNLKKKNFKRKLTKTSC